MVTSCMRRRKSPKTTNICDCNIWDAQRATPGTRQGAWRSAVVTFFARSDKTWNKSRGDYGGIPTTIASTVLLREKSRTFFMPTTPMPTIFLIKELQCGFLNQFENTTYSDPKQYFVDETAAEEFDKTFPPKIKQKQEGQLA